MSLERLKKKAAFLSKPKCLNGIKELNIECDGRAIICQMGTKNGSATTTTTIEDYGFDLKKLFNSAEVRDKRLNCQTCELNCQQHIFFNPGADKIHKIAIRFLTLIPRSIVKYRRISRKAESSQ